MCQRSQRCCRRARAPMDGCTGRAGRHSTAEHRAGPAARPAPSPPSRWRGGAAAPRGRCRSRGRAAPAVPVRTEPSFCRPRSAPKMAAGARSASSGGGGSGGGGRARRTLLREGCCIERPHIDGRRLLGGGRHNGAASRERHTPRVTCGRREHPAMGGGGAQIAGTPVPFWGPLSPTPLRGPRPHFGGLDPVLGTPIPDPALGAPTPLWGPPSLTLLRKPRSPFPLRGSQSPTPLQGPRNGGPDPRPRSGDPDH